MRHITAVGLVAYVVQKLDAEVMTRSSDKYPLTISMTNGLATTGTTPVGTKGKKMKAKDDGDKEIVNDVKRNRRASNSGGSGLAVGKRKASAQTIQGQANSSDRGSTRFLLQTMLAS